MRKSVDKRDISHIGMCCPKGLWFLGLFGPKTGIHFVHFGLESSVVFEGTTGVYAHNYHFQFQMNKNEIEIYKYETHLKNFLIAL